MAESQSNLTTLSPSLRSSYADIAFGRQSPCPPGSEGLGARENINRSPLPPRGESPSPPPPQTSQEQEEYSHLPPQKPQLVPEPLNKRPEPPPRRHPRPPEKKSSFTKSLESGRPASASPHGGGRPRRPPRLIHLKDSSHTESLDTQSEMIRPHSAIPPETSTHKSLSTATPFLRTGSPAGYLTAEGKSPSYAQIFFQSNTSLTSDQDSDHGDIEELPLDGEMNPPPPPPINWDDFIPSPLVDLAEADDVLYRHPTIPGLILKRDVSPRPPSRNSRRHRGAGGAKSKGGIGMDEEETDFSLPQKIEVEMKESEESESLGAPLPPKRKQKTNLPSLTPPPPPADGKKKKDDESLSERSKIKKHKKKDNSGDIAIPTKAEDEPKKEELCIDQSPKMSQGHDEEMSFAMSISDGKSSKRGKENRDRKNGKENSESERTLSSEQNKKESTEVSSNVEKVMVVDKPLPSLEIDTGAGIEEEDASISISETSKSKLKKKKGKKPKKDDDELEKALKEIARDEEKLRHKTKEQATQVPTLPKEIPQSQKKDMEFEEEISSISESTPSKNKKRKGKNAQKVLATDEMEENKEILKAEELLPHNKSKNGEKAVPEIKQDELIDLDEISEQSNVKGKKKKNKKQSTKQSEDDDEVEKALKQIEKKEQQNTNKKQAATLQLTSPEKENTTGMESGENVVATMSTPLTKVENPKVDEKATSQKISLVGGDDWMTLLDDDASIPMVWDDDLPQEKVSKDIIIPPKEAPKVTAKEVKDNSKKKNKTNKYITKSEFETEPVSDPTTSSSPSVISPVFKKEEKQTHPHSKSESQVDTKSKSDVESERPRTISLQGGDDWMAMLDDDFSTPMIWDDDEVVVEEAPKVTQVVSKPIPKVGGGQQTPGVTSKKDKRKSKKSEDVNKVEEFPPPLATKAEMKPKVPPSEQEAVAQDTSEPLHLTQPSKDSPSSKKNKRKSKKSESEPSSTQVSEDLKVSVVTPPPVPPVMAPTFVTGSENERPRTISLQAGDDWMALLDDDSSTPMIWDDDEEVVVLTETLPQKVETRTETPKPIQEEVKPKESDSSKQKGKRKSKKSESENEASKPPTPSNKTKEAEQKALISKPPPENNAVDNKQKRKSTKSESEKVPVEKEVVVVPEIPPAPPREVKPPVLSLHGGDDWMSLLDDDSTPMIWDDDEVSTTPVLLVEPASASDDKPQEDIPKDKAQDKPEDKSPKLSLLPQSQAKKNTRKPKKSESEDQAPPSTSPLTKPIIPSKKEQNKSNKSESGNEIKEDKEKQKSSPPMKVIPPPGPVKTEFPNKKGRRKTKKSESENEPLPPPPVFADALPPPPTPPVTPEESIKPPSEVVVTAKPTLSSGISLVGGDDWMSLLDDNTPMSWDDEEEEEAVACPVADVSPSKAVLPPPRLTEEEESTVIVEHIPEVSQYLLDIYSNLERPPQEKVVSPLFSPERLAHQQRTKKKIALPDEYEIFVDPATTPTQKIKEEVQRQSEEKPNKGNKGKKQQSKQTPPKGSHKESESEENKNTKELPLAESSTIITTAISEPIVKDLPTSGMNNKGNNRRRGKKSEIEDVKAEIPLPPTPSATKETPVTSTQLETTKVEKTSPTISDVLTGVVLETTTAPIIVPSSVKKGKRKSKKSESEEGKVEPPPISPKQEVTLPQVNPVPTVAPQPEKTVVPISDGALKQNKTPTISEPLVALIEQTKVASPISKKGMPSSKKSEDDKGEQSSTTTPPLPKTVTSEVPEKTAATTSPTVITQPVSPKSNRKPKKSESGEVAETPTTPKADTKVNRIPDKNSKGNGKKNSESGNSTLVSCTPTLEPLPSAKTSHEISVEKVTTPAIVPPTKESIPSPKQPKGKRRSGRKSESEPIVESSSLPTGAVPACSEQSLLGKVDAPQPSVNPLNPTHNVIQQLPPPPPSPLDSFADDVDLTSVGPSNEFVASQQFLSLQLKQQQQTLLDQEFPSVPVSTPSKSSPKTSRSTKSGNSKLVKKASSEDSSSEEKRVRFKETPEVVKFGTHDAPLVVVPSSTTPSAADGDVDTNSDDNSSSVASSLLQQSKHKKKKKRSPGGKGIGFGLAHSPLMFDAEHPPRSPSPLPPFEREGEEEDVFTLVKVKKKSKPKVQEEVAGDDDDLPPLEPIALTQVVVENNDVILPPLLSSGGSAPSELVKEEEVLVDPSGLGDLLPPLIPPPPETEVDGRSVDSTESWTNILDEEEPKLTLAVEDMESVLNLEVEQVHQPLQETSPVLPPLLPNQKPHKSQVSDESKNKKDTGLLFTSAYLSAVHLESAESSTPTAYLDCSSAETLWQEYLALKSSKKLKQDESMAKISSANVPSTQETRPETSATGDGSSQTLAEAAKEVTAQMEQLTRSIITQSSPSGNKSEEGEYLSSSLVHLLLVYNDYEREFRESSEKKRELSSNKADKKAKGPGNGGSGGSTSPKKKQDPPPPPPKSGGGGGSGGGGRKGPVTELLCAGLPSLNWVDWSTSLSSGPDQSTHPPRPALQANICKIKESAREDVTVLGQAVDAAIATLSTLSTVNLHDTVERTWELLGGLKDLDGASRSLQEILESLPPSDEDVTQLRTSLTTVHSRLSTILGETTRLNESAKIQLLDFEKQHPTQSAARTEEDHLIPSSSSPTTPIQPQDVPVVEVVGVQPEETENGVGSEAVDISAGDGPVIITPSENEQADMENEITVSGTLVAAINVEGEQEGTNPIELEIQQICLDNDDNAHVTMVNPTDSSSNSFLRTVEESTSAIPPQGTMSFVTRNPDGSKYLTNMERTVVVNQRREMTQSVTQMSSTSDGSSSSSTTMFRTISSSCGGDGDVQRAVTPDLVEDIPPFSLPSGVSQETEELVRSPTQSRKFIHPEDGDSLTVRVRQVTKHVTRRVIRKRRRIIRKVVIVNGKEIVTEEVIDEPDEVDESTAELTSGPIVDFSSSGDSLQPPPLPSSPGVIITEIDFYTPATTPDITLVPEEVEDAVKVTLKEGMGPIISREQVKPLIQESLLKDDTISIQSSVEQETIREDVEIKTDSKSTTPLPTDLEKYDLLQPVNEKQSAILRLTQAAEQYKFPVEEVVATRTLTWKTGSPEDLQVLDPIVSRDQMEPLIQESLLKEPKQHLKSKSTSHLQGAATGVSGMDEQFGETLDEAQMKHDGSFLEKVETIQHGTDTIPVAEDKTQPPCSEFKSSIPTSQFTVPQTPEVAEIIISESNSRNKIKKSRTDSNSQPQKEQQAGKVVPHERDIEDITSSKTHSESVLSLSPDISVTGAKDKDESVIPQEIAINESQSLIFQIPAKIPDQHFRTENVFSPSVSVPTEESVGKDNSSLPLVLETEKPLESQETEKSEVSMPSLQITMIEKVSSLLSQESGEMSDTSETKLDQSQTATDEPTIPFRDTVKLVGDPELVENVTLEPSQEIIPSQPPEERKDNSPPPPPVPVPIDRKKKKENHKAKDIEKVKKLQELRPSEHHYSAHAVESDTSTSKAGPTSSDMVESLQPPESDKEFAKSGESTSKVEKKKKQGRATPDEIPTTTVDVNTGTLHPSSFSQSADDPICKNVQEDPSTSCIKSHDHLSSSQLESGIDTLTDETIDVVLRVQVSQEQRKSPSPTPKRKPKRMDHESDSSLDKGVDIPPMPSLVSSQDEVDTDHKILEEKFQLVKDKDAKPRLVSTNIEKIHDSAVQSEIEETNKGLEDKVTANPTPPALLQEIGIESCISMNKDNDTISIQSSVEQETIREDVEIKTDSKSTTPLPTDLEKYDLLQPVNEKQSAILRLTQAAEQYKFPVEEVVATRTLTWKTGSPEDLQVLDPIVSRDQMEPLIQESLLKEPKQQELPKNEISTEQTEKEEKKFNKQHERMINSEKSGFVSDDSTREQQISLAPPTDKVDQGATDEMLDDDKPLTSDPREVTLSQSPQDVEGQRDEALKLEEIKNDQDEIASSMPISSPTQSAAEIQALETDNIEPSFLAGSQKSLQAPKAVTAVETESTEKSSVPAPQKKDKKKKRKKGKREDLSSSSNTEEQLSPPSVEKVGEVIRQELVAEDNKQSLSKSTSLLQGAATSLGTDEAQIKHEVGIPSLQAATGVEVSSLLPQKSVESGTLKGKLDQTQATGDEIESSMQTSAKDEPTIPFEDSGAKLVGGPELLEDVLQEPTKEIFPSQPSEERKVYVPPPEEITSLALEQLSKKDVASALSSMTAQLDSISTAAAEIIGNANDPLSVQISALDELELQLQSLRPNIIDLVNKADAFSYPEIAAQSLNMESTLAQLVLNIAEENERLLQLRSISEEYEATLQEFEQVIAVAEALVSPQVVVRNLSHLQGEVQKNRKFFTNLKRCQQALEKLEYGLDPSTKELHQTLHHRLYDEATSILERAGKKRQKMAVAAARWVRLEQGLEEEGHWLRSISKKIPSLENVASGEVDRFCSTYQSLYSDIIVHQARLMQLRTVSECLREVVTSPGLELGASDTLVDQLLELSARVTSGLQSLVAFRDFFTNYERLHTRLKGWLQKAEGKMDSLAIQPQSHPYDFWELKAQLESQQPLRNEASILLEQSLCCLQVSDERAIRGVFSNFEDRWCSLVSAVASTELSSFQGGIDSETAGSSVADRLGVMGEELDGMIGVFGSMLIQVESEDDLYLYLEKLQILKAQILNKRHQLTTVLPKEGGVLDAEGVADMLTQKISNLDSEVTAELDVAHTVREKFATFGRMSLKTRRLQDTLRARVDQWASFFELSQDILKQALQNCQTLDEDISKNHVDLDRMRNLLSTSFPSTPHLALNTGKMEIELHEMEAIIHTLSARIQDLRKRVQEQLGFWQQYDQLLNSITLLTTQTQTTLDLVKERTSASYTSQHGLQVTQKHLKDALKLLNTVPTPDLERIATLLKADSPTDVQQQIDLRVNGVLAEWRELSDQLQSYLIRTESALSLWAGLDEKKVKLVEWLRQFPSEFIPQALLQRLPVELPLQEQVMNELHSLASELCLTLSLDGADEVKHQLPLTLELEGLSRKLLSLKNYLSTVRNVITPAEQRLLEEATLTLSSATEELNQNIPPSLDRLDNMHQQLLRLGDVEGKMKALEVAGEAPSQLAQLLATSQEVFHSALEEYIGIWNSVPDRVQGEQVVSLWHNSLEQCRLYLSQPLPFDESQLISDSALCSVYSTILNGQADSLSTLVEQRPSDFSPVQELYTQLENELLVRQESTSIRLQNWSEYRIALTSLSKWLQRVEKEKQSLHLPFLPMKRLPFVQQQIDSLINSLDNGEGLLGQVKAHHDKLLPLCPPELKSQLCQELSAASTRLDNLRAALSIWKDHVNRLLQMECEVEAKISQISSSLSSFRDQFGEEKPPASFAELKKFVKSIEKLYKNTTALTPQLESLAATIEHNVKPSIKPSDTRLLLQRHWSLSQGQVELLDDLGQVKAEAEQKLDLLPIFDTKCKSFLLWVKAAKHRLERPSSQNLEDYLSTTLERELVPEVTLKHSAFQWLSQTGDALLEMTSGKEKKELLRVLKEVRSQWGELHALLEQRRGRVNYLIKLVPEIQNRTSALEMKLKHLENYLSRPVNLTTLSGTEIAKALSKHEGEQKRLNNESVEVNELLKLCELGATQCEDLLMYYDAHHLRRKFEGLDDRWKQLISGFSAKKEGLITLKGKVAEIEEKCELLEMLLAQVGETLNSVESTGLQAELIQELLTSLQAMSPKVEDLSNDYSFLTKQVHASDQGTGPLSCRVKGVLQQWKSHLTKCHQLLQKDEILNEFKQSCSEADCFYQNLCLRAEKLQAHSDAWDAEDLSRKIVEIRDNLSSQTRVLHSTLVTSGKTVVGLDSGMAQTVKEHQGHVKSLKSYLDTLVVGLEREVERKQREEEEVEEMDKDVQVNTLTGEHDAEVQVESLELPTPTSPVSYSENDEFNTTLSVTLTRESIYLEELVKTIQSANVLILELAESLKESSPHDMPVKMLAVAQSTTDQLGHLHKLLVEEHDFSPEEAHSLEVLSIRSQLKELEAQIRSVGQKLREGGSSPSRTDASPIVPSCPVCSPAQRGAWDSTLWRLEQWLTHAEGKLKTAMKKRPPAPIEQLEDAVLRHRELVLDLDSHRYLVHSLSGVLSHLNEHGETSTIGSLERERLQSALVLWKKVCHETALWQARLQIALIENSGFHENLSHYEGIVEDAQQNIKSLEPVDLSQGRPTVLAKWRRFAKMRDQLVRLEPEIATLLATAEQLFVNPTAIEREGICSPGPSDQDIFVGEESATILNRISAVNHQLKALIKVCDAYVRHVSVFIRGNYDGRGEFPMRILSEEILERSGRSSPALARPRSPHHSTATSSDNEDGTRPPSVLVRGGRYITRVVRASLPIQALILLLLGAATFIPYGEDYLCTHQNNFKYSLEPMLGYPDGPPPI